MAELTQQIIAEDLQTKFGQYITNVEEPYGFLTFTATRETIINVLEYLYFNKQYQVQFLTDICGVHYPNYVNNEFAVVYHLHSLVNNIRLRIKVFLNKNDLKIPTATSIFATANWMERETFDFYGIEFEGHPNLVRILNVDDMDYFPLRKEYPLEDQTRRDKENLFFGR
jgi:NADH-quinone oxidoreductase subunit C